MYKQMIDIDRIFYNIGHQEYLWSNSATSVIFQKVMLDYICGNSIGTCFNLSFC